MMPEMTLRDWSDAVEAALRDLVVPKQKQNDCYTYLRTWVYPDNVIYQQDGETGYARRSYSFDDAGQVVIGTDEEQVAQTWVEAVPKAAGRAMNMMLRGM